MSLSIASKLLVPLSFVYGAGMRARTAFYRRGIFKTHHITAPVISVGNITTGGTGKTPLVAYLAREVSMRGHRPCILTRGYGRIDENARVVVRDGTKILADSRAGGDEPRLLAEILNDTNAIIISDANRVEAARWALQKFATNYNAQESSQKLIFILDDGFQHQRLARNLDIVTLDATAPFGDKHLLPRGRLREPLDALKRADAILISRADQAGNLDALCVEARRLTHESTPIFTTRLRTRALHPLDNFSVRVGNTNNFRKANVSDALTPNAAVAAFCALGNPASFFTHLQKENYKVAYTRAFRDHHIYTQNDIDALISEARQRGASVLLTTMKDAVKLQDFHFALPAVTVDVELMIDDEEKFREMIARVI